MPSISSLYTLTLTLLYLISSDIIDTRELFYNIFIRILLLTS